MRKEPRGSSPAGRVQAATSPAPVAQPVVTETIDTSSRRAIEPATVSRRYLGILLALFAASGCAGLIYEVVWFQLLEFTIGASGVSLGLLLAAYMGGLCAGSIALSRFVSRRLHPLRVYALLEAGVAVFGIVALFAIPLIGRVYGALSPGGVTGLVLRGIVAALCLLPPTVLMGASLPALSRSVETDATGISRIGLLYSANVAGAVLGCVLAGFYILRLYDVAVATTAAALLNLMAAAGAWVLSKNTLPHTGADTGIPGRTAPGAALILIVTAISGLTALGGEVIWTRLLSLLLGGTVYTFSIILAVFLAGLWAGSAGGSVIARRRGNARLALAVCQILLAVAIAWTTFTLARVLPWWPVDPGLAVSPWFNFDLDITRCLRTILPATLLWGASFPLALAAAAAPDEDPARLSGSVYAANTAGSIVGALAFSLLLIPSVGTRGAQQLLIWLAAASGAVALLALGSAAKRLWVVGGAVAALLLAAGLSATVSAMPWQAIAYGRRIAPVLQNAATDSQPLFMGEGIDSSVVITGNGNQRFFYVSGKSEASSAPIDMRLQRMMGHLPALFQGAPKSALVVGFGAGVTAGSFVPYPGVGSITICELESLIPPASNEFFGKENNHVLEDGRTKLVHDDARHFMLTSHDKFDVITTDPIHPWVKGASTLYTRQFYEEEKAHLNPGGVVAQWLPNYESDEETVKVELATFFSVFPNGTVWSNYVDGDGFDLVLIGREDARPIDVDVLDKQLNSADYRAVASSLAEVDFPSAVALLASYAGRAQDLQGMLQGVPVNEDTNLRLQYLAGSGVNTKKSLEIYRDILRYRRFPDGLLTGSGERIEALRSKLTRKFRTF